MSEKYVESREGNTIDNLGIVFSDKTPFVNQLERSYSVNLISAPEVIKGKEHLFLDNKVVVVGVDIIRCSTTSCALLAAGAKGIRYYGKRVESIRKAFLDFDYYIRKGFSCASMGEFAGKSLPGGIAANSPKAISVELVKGKWILFLTKNLGDVNSDITDMIEKNNKRWRGKFIIGCLFNIGRILEFIQSLGKTRIVICCGGFRKTESLEDLFFAGKLVKMLKFPEKDCDDAALSAVAVYEKYKNVKNLYVALKYCRVAKVLTEFGMADDIHSCLTGKYIDTNILRSMRNTLPMLGWKNRDTWFLPK